MENGDLLPFRLLLECPSGLSPSQVSIVYDEAYDRIPHPDINLENSISEIWNQRAQKNSSLFNGTKFRYGGHLLPGGSDTDQDQHACLYLGLTDYRTFMGTNLNPQWEKFLVPSEDDCRRCQHTSSPLGNGAIVETFDKKILVLQRSYNVGEFPGHYVFPGGHPEANDDWHILNSIVRHLYFHGGADSSAAMPQEVGIISHQFDEGKNDVKQSNESICKEMFDSIIREVVEEIGVPEASLGNPLFIGISRRVLNVRPAAFFFIKCSLRSDEIQQLYSTAVDGYESTQLYTVSKSELEVMAAKMPGCHQGGFALYKSMVTILKDS